MSNIIEAWAETKRIEEFFADAERRAADLIDDEKEIVLERLKLAREMVGGTDALKWLRSWKTPDERYAPKRERTAFVIDESGY